MLGYKQQWSNDAQEVLKRVRRHWSITTSLTVANVQLRAFPLVTCRQHFFLRLLLLLALRTTSELKKNPGFLISRTCWWNRNQTLLKTRLSHLLFSNNTTRALQTMDNFVPSASFPVSTFLSCLPRSISKLRSFELKLTILIFSGLRTKRSQAYKPQCNKDLRCLVDFPVFLVTPSSLCT